MRLLIIGLGSIGKRHLRNALEIGVEEVVLVRRNGTTLDGYTNLKVYSCISQALKEMNFQAAIIATPTANHLQDLKELLAGKVPHIYVEKPIASDLLEAQSYCNQLQNIKVWVGYDLRFDFGLNKCKELVEDNCIGKPISFIAEVGQYLPDWRPDQDYKESMSAKKKLGGGVMLDLVHEFDYLHWLFGPVLSIYGQHANNSHLAIETEDISVNIIETKEGILGSLHLDYLQRKLSRTLKVIGEEGTIVWDYAESTIRWLTSDNLEWQEMKYNHLERNDRFLAILKAFLDSIDGKIDKRLVSFNEGIESLALLTASKTAHKNGEKQIL